MWDVLVFVVFISVFVFVVVIVDVIVVFLVVAVNVVTVVLGRLRLHLRFHAWDSHRIVFVFIVFFASSSFLALFMTTRTCNCRERQADTTAAAGKVASLVISG